MRSIFALTFIFLLFSFPAFAIPVLFSQNYQMGQTIPEAETITVTEPVLQLKLGEGAIQFQKSSVFRVISTQPAVIEIISGDVQVFTDDKNDVVLRYNERTITIDKNSALQATAGDRVSGHVYKGNVAIVAAQKKRGFSAGEKFSIEENSTQAELESLGAIAPAAGGDEQASEETASGSAAVVNTANSTDQIQNQVAADFAFLSAQEDILNRVSGNENGDNDGGSGDPVIDDGSAPLYPPTAIPLEGQEFAGGSHRTLDKPQSRSYPLTRKEVVIGDDGMPIKITERATPLFAWFWDDYIERVTARIAEAQGGRDWQVGRITDGTVNVFDTFETETLKQRTLSRNEGLHYALGTAATNIPTESVGVYKLAAATRPTYVDGSTAPGTLSGDIKVLFGSIPTVGVNLIATMPDGTWRLFKDPASDPVDMVSTIGAGYGGFTIAPQVTGDACTGDRSCVGSVIGSLVGEGATGAAITFEASSGTGSPLDGTYAPDRLLSGAGYFNRIP